MTERASQRPLVCVQGLGFVGSAMAIAVADARIYDSAAVAIVDVPLDLRSGACFSWPDRQAVKDSVRQGALSGDGRERAIAKRAVAPAFGA